MSGASGGTVLVVGQAARDLVLRVEKIRESGGSTEALDSGIDVSAAIRTALRADATSAPRELLTAGPSLVALAVPGEGDVVAWPGGDCFLPHGSEPVVDPTGAGDAFVAGLVTRICRGLSPDAAGKLASVAASAAVTRLGGRPDLRSLTAERA